jgi:tetratricopeptide (TPR) repeat protein
MIVEIIKALGSAWPLLLLLFLGGWSWYLRKPIKRLAERITNVQVKGGPVELSLTQATTVIESKTEALAGAETPLLSSPAEEAGKIVELESKTEGDAWSDMLDAYGARDFDRLEEAFGRYQASEVDAVKKLEDQSFYLFLRFQIGDVNALEKMKELAKNEAVAGPTYYSIGVCYETGNNYASAAEAFELAAQKQPEAKKADSVTALARCLFKMGRRQEAYARIMRELGLTTDPQVASDLYVGLAERYEEAKEMELRSLALEKALESKLNDTSLLFNTAYSYSHIDDASPLSFLHYKTLLKFDPNHQRGLDNLGVACDRLKMPVAAVSSYKKSAKLKNTLAAANLANLYLREGFAEEAQELLDEARLQTEVNPGVGKMMARLSEMRETEEKIEERQLKIAREQQVFFLSYAESRFTIRPEPPNFNSTWKLPDGIEVTSTQTESQLQLSWVRDENHYKFEGSLINRAAKGKIHYVHDNVTTVWNNDTYLCMSSDDQRLQLMTIDSSSQSFMVMAAAGKAE